MASDKNKRPDFSVIIPTYNRANYLRLAIVSVLRQKNVTMEIIVSDDGSTDDTEKLVKSFQDRSIRYIKNKIRLGTAMNFRQCFLASRGDYIFTLGDDDFILDEYTLQDIRKMIKYHNLGMVKIGAFGYENSPLNPYQILTLGNRPLIRKPESTRNILTQTISFGLGYFSGLTFNNRVLDKRAFDLDHRCHPDHMCPIERSAAYDLIKRYGIGYIPDHFIVGHLSLQLIPRYFSLKKAGWFFMGKPIELAKKFTSSEEHKMFTKVYLRSQVVLLPNIRFYTNYDNYCRVLERMIRIDQTLLYDPRFILFGLMGFLPKTAIKMLRLINVYLSQGVVKIASATYRYPKKVTNILKDKRLSEGIFIIG